MNSKITNALLIAVQALLSLMFLMAGTMKIITPYDELKAGEGMGWTADFSPTSILGIGTVEFVLAACLLSALFVDLTKKYTSIWAGGICAVMVGAAITHIGRGEPFVPNLVFFTFAAVVAIARRDQLKTS
jgi:hypothetical protein